MEILPEYSSVKDLYFRVIRRGSLEDIGTLLRHGANINWREDTEIGITGLLVAVSRKSMNLLDFLLSNGADVNLAYLGVVKGVNPLMVACGLGEPAMVERLCQVPGINLNYRADMGYTALMFAVDRNHPECVEKLRAIAGVDWNAVVTKNGNSAIMIAVLLGHVGVVEALLPVSTLDMTITDSDGYSVAHKAVMSEEVSSLRILELLCQDGRVDWNINTWSGVPVLMALERNKVGMFRALVRTPGVDTNITDEEGKSLVQLVMEHENPQFRGLLWGLDQVNIQERFYDCPVCNVKYSSQLQVFQCARGHFICGECRPKLDPDHCPTCREEIIGRVIDFEKFLQGLQMESE